MSEQKLSGIMAACVAEAENTIRTMLWNDADLAKIAGVALAGNLPPDRVDKLADEIAEARAILVTAEEHAARLPEMQKALAAATATAKKTADALTRAEEADTAARAALREPEAAILAEDVARNAALHAALRGTIPADHRPAWLVSMVEQHEATRAREDAGTRAAAMRRYIAERERAVAEIQQDLNDASDHGGVRHLAPDGQSYTQREVLERRLKDAQEKLDAARAELSRLEKQV